MLAILNVGPGQKYATIASAVSAAAPGDTIDVQAGIYTNDFIGIYKNLTLQAVGGPVKLVATINAPNGKAIIDEGGKGISVTINGFDVSGAKVTDQNGAAVRYEGGNLTLNNVYFHNNEEGLLGAADLAGSITVNNSEFAFNGRGDGFTHNFYAGHLANVTIANSYFHDAAVGHEIKSRAENTTITGTRIFDNNGTASYSVDAPNGGNVTLRNDVIEQGPNSQNPYIIAYGEEGALHVGKTLSVTGNTFINDKSGGALFLNRGGTLGFSGNELYGLTASSLAAGSTAGNTVLTSRPALDKSSGASGSSASRPSSGGGTPSQPNVTIRATETSTTVSASNISITATAGNHTLFIGGTHDVAILTGGKEIVQASQGYNSITTGAWNDTIRFGGPSNTINAGAGNNTLQDSGTGSTIVLPAPWTGSDNITGAVLTNGDKLDFRAALKATNWNGLASDIGRFVHVRNSGADAIINVSTFAGGAGSMVADLHGVGPVNLNTILAHSII